jgi:hypothetical protein
MKDGLIDAFGDKPEHFQRREVLTKNELGVTVVTSSSRNVPTGWLVLAAASTFRSSRK